MVQKAVKPKETIDQELQLFYGSIQGPVGWP